MLVCAAFVAPLLFVASAAASPSPVVPPVPVKRHSYAQYFAAGHPPHQAQRYGFENPDLAKHYDERELARLVAGQVGSVTWLEEMASMGKKPDEAPCV